ncbi:hypothetical protein F5B20DRAFT_426973 [Whalleya microplaca]|nr:hypothetical protein F5B20DRAFT_426973 [Whalleya microplaca]
MTDPFSTAASIITVLQLCASIAGCINTATGARKERERLLGEIRACEQIICKLKNHADGSEEDTAWLETVKALEAPDAPLGRLRIALSTVESKLRPKEGIQKTLASLKWPFSEKEVEKMFAAIEREKALLELALQNNSRKLIQEIKRTTTKNNTTLKDLIEAIRSHSSQTHGELLELKYGIDNIHNEQNQDKAARSRENIIKWLTRVDYAAQQSDYIARRQAGTGQWLLDSVEFTTWVESSKKTLFCPGIPGSGKTILTSIVIDNLMTRFSGNDTIGVAYLYCNYKQHSDQTAKYLLTDLLKQLTHRRLSLPDCVKSLYSKYEEQGKVAPSFDDISKTLQSVCRLYTKVFVAVDAIDECQKSDGHRSTLLKEIFALQAQNDVNIFATSRKIDEIAQMFVNSQSHEIRAQPEDVRRYVEGRISQLPSFVQRKPDLQEDIKNEIVKAVDGMFLLAQLHLDSLVGIRSPKAVRAALAKLPSGTFETYDEALKRIDAQVVDQVELAKQTLSWIVCAHRPLTTTELRHALAVEIGEPELDDENMSEIDDIISVCAGMVTVDIESDIVRLVHYTAQTFFASRQKEWLPHAQTDITRTCVAYLSFDVFEAGFSNSDEEFEERLRSNPLYDYAAHNWGHHARIAVTEAGHAINPKLPGPGQARNFENPDATQQIILTLFSNSNKLFASNQTLFARKWNGRRYYTEVPTRFTPIHTASYFGLEDIVVSLLQQNLDPNARDSYGRTPLWVAAQNGHGMVVETLLRTVGVEPDSKDLTFGATPLFKAAEAGYYKIVELLLAQESVDPISKDKYGQTPLLVAAGAGHYEIVELFLAKGVDPISKDKFATFS